MSLPAHIQQTIAELRVRRAEIDEALTALLAIYGADETPARQTAAPVTPRRPRALKAVRSTSDAPTAPSVEAHPLAGSKYDADILRALKSEAAAHGLSCTDIARTMTRPGSPELPELVKRVFVALTSLQKRAQVRKDGRMWHIVRPGDQA